MAETTMIRSPWAREYARTRTTYIWGRAPSGFARRVSKLLPRGALVLDLGCGEGRDAVFFASCGFQVTGVEISLAGLRKAERLARDRGVRVRWVHGDIARLALRGAFDLVYSCGAIHYVPRSGRTRLFDHLAALTRPAGYHAHIVFTDRRVYVEKGEVIDYFEPGEIARVCAHWRILHRAARTIVCARDGTPHRHSVEQLIARKPA